MELATETYSTFHPVIKQCIEQLYDQIQGFNDYIAYNALKELITLLQDRMMKIETAFSIFLKKIMIMPDYETYLVTIQHMFTKYDKMSLL